MTVVCIHQPDFAPWIGFFDRLIRSDIFVVLDNVQFLRRGWHHRDKIKTPNGPMWLTVPVKKRGKFHQTICNVEIDNTKDWRREHLNTIQMNYARSLHFNDQFGEIEEIYGSHWDLLAGLNMALIGMFMRAFGITIEVVKSSDLDAAGTKNELLINILKAVGGNRYLVGEGSRDYLDEALFQDNGIEVQWQSFRHPDYPQLHGAFEPGLSSYDFLLNCGAEKCADVLRGG